MLTALLRLMTIVALAIMPLGMAAAPASTSKSDDPVMTSADHCPEPVGTHDAAPLAAMDCQASCNALPVLAAVETNRSVTPSLPRETGTTVIFDDNIPEIATPPPRLG